MHGQCRQILVGRLTTSNVHSISTPPHDAAMYVIPLHLSAHVSPGHAASQAEAGGADPDAWSGVQTPWDCGRTVAKAFSENAATNDPNNMTATAIR